jgi:hypothetical protein
VTCEALELAKPTALPGRSLDEAWLAMAWLAMAGFQRCPMEPYTFQLLAQLMSICPQQCKLMSCGVFVAAADLRLLSANSIGCNQKKIARKQQSPSWSAC